MFTIQSTKTVLFGPGITKALPNSVASTLGRRVLVVTDAAIRHLGLVDPFLAALRSAGVELTIFDGVLPEPPRENVEAAAAIARNIAATGIVGFGGGSAMDVAKVVALLGGGGKTLDDVFGVELAAGPRLPLVLIPTTAGTGSETTPVAILVAGPVKKAVVSRHLLPDIAILDPELSISLPRGVTAATGIDAMVHAIEAFASASPNRNPISQGAAKQALRLLGANLRRVVEDGSDSEGGGAMLLGSFLAGQAFANSPVAAVHALAYPIGGRFHIAHGVSTALMLTHVMRFNLPVAASEYAASPATSFPVLRRSPKTGALKR